MKARLISEPGDIEKITPVRESGLRTALARGLKEYLESYQIKWFDGSEAKFARVLQTWAEPETGATFPAATVYSVDPMSYSAEDGGPAAPMTPRIRKDQVFADGQYWASPSHGVQTLFIEAWSTNPAERSKIEAMLEDAMQPVDWMYGLRLELPFYHGVRAVYEPIQLVHVDNESNASKRYRTLVMEVKARAPRIRVFGVRPKLEVRQSVQPNPPELDPPTAEQQAEQESNKRRGL